jgi:hypothetical protein
MTVRLVPAEITQIAVVRKMRGFRAQGRTIILGADETREVTSEPHPDLFHLPHW